jgi:hypothetical protein
MSHDADFRELADRVLAGLAETGAELAYDRDSVAWIDAYIERNREHFSEEEANKVANNLGAFVGECLRAAHGGTWVHDEKSGEWGVDLGGNLGTAFPAAKIYKQLRNGPEDSVLSFFEVVGAIVAAGGIDRLGSGPQKDEG